MTRSEHYPHPLLDSLTTPGDIAGLSSEQLEELSVELRRIIIETVSRNGGHLAASLGVVELTLALLATFNPGRDKIIWDVGHQAYAYKLLTGRADIFHTLRRLDGMCGFPSREESPYDHFGVGHSSTSISAALGMAHARDLAGDDHHVLAVIGDGSMTAGLAYEGLNQAGDAGRRLIVVLNDNEMSISKNVGALSFFLSRNLSAPWVRRTKKEVEGILGSIPRIGQDITSLVKKGQHTLKSFFTPGMLFEAFRFNYIGPVDGHDMKALTMALEVAREVDKPSLVHVLTVKGKGYGPAEANPVYYHGVGCFTPEMESEGIAAPSKENSRPEKNCQTPPPARPDENTPLAPQIEATVPPTPPASLNEAAQTPKPPSYTSVFGRTLCRLAATDRRIMAITAAMPEGTGLASFAEAFPERFVDVGICEQHAVTFAAGLAAEGLRPVVAVYSTFLQRSYDQIVHDVCLQKLPVFFGIDRAGLVGEDGATHQGAFDIAYLRHIPHLMFMAPKDEAELARGLVTGLSQDAPFALRYPRGAGLGVPLPEAPENLPPLPVGEAEMLLRGDGSMAIIALGTMVAPAIQAAALLREQYGKSITVCNARWIKPLPEKDLLELARNHKALLFVEEGTLAGGFSSAALEFFADAGLRMPPCIRRLGLPDRFIEHGPGPALRQRYGLDAEGIVKAAKELLKKEA